MIECKDFAPDLIAQCDCINCGHPFEAHAKPKRQMTIASFCAMTCAEGGFHKFLQEVEGVNVTDAASAKDYILGKCGIESRTELNAKGPEQEAWLHLQAQYQDWLRT